jgi:serine protease Do
MRLPRTWFVVLACWSLLLGTDRPAWALEKETQAALRVPENRDFGKAALLKSNNRKTPIVELVQRVKGAVVNIHSERTVHNAIAGDSFTMAPPSPNRVNGMGTGIIIDHRGYIITNHHVIEDVSVIRIRLCDGSTQIAQVVARCPEMDLALLKINTNHPLPVMTLGTANDLMVGETVAAIGNAFGYEHTVTVGVVSAVKRDVSLNKEMSYKSLIQTDASINPGNSGGPLLNVNGELIGVNVAIRAGAQGIGFAIPVDNMIRVVEGMLRSRRQTATYDGLRYRDRLEAGADGLVRKVVVESNEANSPASMAGVRKGDVLLKVGDVPVTCGYDVERGLMDHNAGELVPVVVRRQGQERRLELALASSDRSRPGPGDVIRAKLGVQLKVIDAEVVSRVNHQLHGGLEVTAVDESSVAAKAGIRQGDILVGLHQWETLTVDNVAFVLSHPDLPHFTPLSFYIVRSGQVRRGYLGQVN